MTAPNINYRVTYIGATPTPDQWSGSDILFQPNQTYSVSAADYPLLIAQSTLFIDGDSRLMAPSGIAGQIEGSQNSDSAIAGNIGEYMEAIRTSGSAVSLTSGTPANITTLTLTPGEWDVFGVIEFAPAATTSVTELLSGTNTTSATVGTLGTYQRIVTAAQVPGSALRNAIAAPVYRISVGAGTTTTVYLIARATFTVSTCTAYGDLRARRVR